MSSCCHYLASLKVSSPRSVARAARPEHASQSQRIPLARSYSGSLSIADAPSVVSPAASSTNYLAI
ncbi:hypothetical protein FIBSPDRAFT_876483 [Athelia psychrophila]|uniref:Uncharacterized protein n=1 Tax=Athelia psychrophila TaxID=1759441 RepID=A0A167WU46_9AGAM|nr:hypothetical protein FIBSPDRAFT_876483 [Fibularhizoctonia sp. CBS 109695]